MELNTIRDNKGANKKLLRVGRGIGSGKGKTAGRGNKGQKSRSGVAIKGKGFEGGQTPIYRRLPKVGFNNTNFANNMEIINLKTIQELVDNKLITDKLNIDILKSLNVIKKSETALKVLGKGELKASVETTANSFSASAKTAIEKAGGKVIVVEVKDTAAKKQKLNKEKVARITKKLAKKSK